MGALLNWVKLQNNARVDDKLLFSIVGWHALTLPQDPRMLSDARREMLAVLLAIGLDPNRSIIFYQEDVCDSYFPCLISRVELLGALVEQKPY